MGHALSGVIRATEPKGGYATKDHLDPCDQREGLANHPVSCYEHGAYTGKKATSKVEAEVDPKANLDGEKELELRGE